MNAWRGVRGTIDSKVAQREAALEKKERAAEEAALCALCMERPKAVALGCGHQTCSKCADEHNSCPFCRKTIQHRIILYQS